MKSIKKIFAEILPYFIGLIVISATIWLIVIVCKISDINNGYDSNFIEQVPYFNKGLEQQKINYDALIKLYQSRRTNISWMIALFGATMTFLAFWVQTRANINQKEDIEKERYENKLFHLLDVYRDICHNTKIEKAGEGKVAFHYMFYEYKAIYFIIDNDEDKNIKAEIKNCQHDPSDSNLINYLAFTYFINGVTANKIDTSIKENVITDLGKRLIRDKLLELQEKSEKKYWTKIDDSPNYLCDYSQKQIKFFDGHRPRFIPYIKYIELILDFISKNIDKSKDGNDSSIKFLIKEQTDHEIGLIYAYNKYVEYRDNIVQDELREQLWEKMYNDISPDMVYKFKFDNPYFIK
jgi:hypothetical protein